MCIKENALEQWHSQFKCISYLNETKGTYQISIKLCILLVGNYNYFMNITILVYLIFQNV